MKYPASVINFIAAYGTHQTVLDAVTADEKRAAATLLVLGGAGSPLDRLDFLNGTGNWAAQESGLDTVDFWIGGLAEKKMSFGGMLGSTFSFVFEMTMENLQDADRFYYLSRTQGLNLLNELENNTFAGLAMRNTDLGSEESTALPGNLFSAFEMPIIEMDLSKQLDADPVHDDPTLQAISSLVERRDADGDGVAEYIRVNTNEHIVIGGTENNDTIVSGGGDDAIWGKGGDDVIEAGYGVDKVFGGEGDDIITNAGTDIAEADFLHGNEGNDVIHGGSGASLLFGGQGSDFIVTGPDGKEAFGGTGNDFILGGSGGDFLLGNEGDDWLEGGERFDTLAGDNSELFFNSTIVGHDVLNGGSGDTDYDSESGDDIMFQNEGIQRSNGMAGFDWAIHKGDSLGANSDLGIPIFANQEAFILRDRFDLVEGLSGWKHDDVLTGRVEAVNTRAEATGTAAIPAPDAPIDSYSNDLLQKNVSRIGGLDVLVDHLERIAVLDEDGNAVLDQNGDAELIVLDTSDASDILLGGGGSDRIEGKAGNDVIDGDKWLNVRIAIHAIKDDPSSPVIGSAEGMTAQVYDQEGALLYDGRTLDALMFDRTINPGQLETVREILNGDVTGDVDTAVFGDLTENYDFTRNDDGSITVGHVTVTNETDPSTGRNRISDGIDRLFNIENLQFKDGTFTIDQLISVPATGAPVISDATPTEGQTLTIDTSSIADLNGLGPFTYQWQVSEDGGITWSDIPDADGPSFVPNNGFLGFGSQVGDRLRVGVSFTDGGGNPETLYSAPTGVVGDDWNGLPFVNNTFNGTAGDDIADGVSPFIFGGRDTLNGNGGNDTLSGAGGNDTINGGAGDDVITGGDGNDMIIQTGATGGRDLINGSGGNDTYQINGVDGAETFTIYSRTAAAAAITGLTLSASTEIVIARNGVVVAELDNIEEIRVNTLQVTSPGGATGGSNGGDTIQVVGNFNGTSLNFSTITIDGSEGDDVVDIASLTSAHRIVFKSNGGNDTIVGMLRSTDVIELPAGKKLGDYTTVVNDDGTTTLCSDDHEVTYLSSGIPTVREFSAEEMSEPAPAEPIPEAIVPAPVLGPLPVEDVSAWGSRRHDRLEGGEGNDQLYGGRGDDHLSGGGGNDRLYGNSGHDQLVGGIGDDRMWGGVGNDVYIVDSAGDRVIEKGGHGTDMIKSSISYRLSGNVEKLALTGAEDVNGIGNRMDNVLKGNSGDNVLKGGAGDDVLRGGAGDDRLIGGSGNDWLRGGAGQDEFVFPRNGGRDTVTDFRDGQDRVDVSGLSGISQMSDLSVLQVGANVEIQHGNGVLVLQGVSAADLDQSDFIF